MKHTTFTDETTKSCALGYQIFFNLQQYLWSAWLSAHFNNRVKRIAKTPSENTNPPLPQSDLVPPLEEELLDYLAVLSRLLKATSTSRAIVWWRAIAYSKAKCIIPFFLHLLASYLPTPRQCPGRKSAFVAQFGNSVRHNWTDEIWLEEEQKGAYNGLIKSRWAANTGLLALVAPSAALYTITGPHVFILWWLLYYKTTQVLTMNKSLLNNKTKLKWFQK